MKYYTLARKVLSGSALISNDNNYWTPFCTGHLLPDNFESPLVCVLDEGSENATLPTMFEDPAVIVKPEMYQLLVSLGLDNFEVNEVVIRSEDGSREITDYVFLNILGRIAGADLDASDVQSIGEGMNIIDTLVMDKSAVRGKRLFLVDEDTDCIVIDEEVYKALSSEFDDLYFEEVTLV